MGAALGAALASRGFRVLWASQGRSTQTAARAKAAGLEDAHSIEQAVKAAEVAVSVCPPDAALALARDVGAVGFGGIYVDANAISPATAREIGRVIEAAGGTFVDGGIIGLPPTAQKQPTLYLCGTQAATIEALFGGTNIHAEVIDGGAGTASGPKMCYAAFTKGTTGSFGGGAGLGRARRRGTSAIRGVAANAARCTAPVRIRRRCGLEGVALVG
jgi:3-hydroxyisobutyrate dehydrogenase-like beta-hydroxyacid dehydrogenase